MGPRQERLLELLDRFQEAEEQGLPIDLAGLCADCPELLDEFRQQVEVHRGFKRFANCEPGITVPTSTVDNSGLLVGRGPRTTAELLPQLPGRHGGADPWGTLSAPEVPGYTRFRLISAGGMGRVY